MKQLGSVESEWGMVTGWGSGRVPPHTHLQFIGAAGTVLLYLHEHPLLQLLQEGEQGLELRVQVLLHLGRVCLEKMFPGRNDQDWSKPMLRRVN